MQIRDEIKRGIFMLQIDVLPDGAEIVAPVKSARRLNAGENAHFFKSQESGIGAACGLASEGSDSVSIARVHCSRNLFSTFPPHRQRISRRPGPTPPAALQVIAWWPRDY